MEVSGVELRVLSLVARGLDVRDVAVELAYTRGYVYEVMQRVRLELGVRTNVGAVVRAVGLGLLELPAAEEVRGDG